MPPKKASAKRRRSESGSPGKGRKRARKEKTGGEPLPEVICQQSRDDQEGNFHTEEEKATYERWQANRADEYDMPEQKLSVGEVIGTALLHAQDHKATQQQIKDFINLYLPAFAKGPRWVNKVNTELNANQAFRKIDDRRGNKYTVAPACRENMFMKSICDKKTAEKLVAATKGREVEEKIYEPTGGRLPMPLPGKPAEKKTLKSLPEMISECILKTSPQLQSSKCDIEKYIQASYPEYCKKMNWIFSLGTELLENKAFYRLDPIVNNDRNGKGDSKGKGKGKGMSKGKGKGKEKYQKLDESIYFVHPACQYAFWIQKNFGKETVTRLLKQYNDGDMYLLKYFDSSDPNAERVYFAPKDEYMLDERRRQAILEEQWKFQDQLLQLPQKTPNFTYYCAYVLYMKNYWRASIETIYADVESQFPEALQKPTWKDLVRAALAQQPGFMITSIKGGKGLWSLHPACYSLYLMEHKFTKSIAKKKIEQFQYPTIADNVDYVSPDVTKNGGPVLEDNGHYWYDPDFTKWKPRPENPKWELQVTAQQVQQQAYAGYTQDNVDPQRQQQQQQQHQQQSTAGYDPNLYNTYGYQQQQAGYNHYHNVQGGQQQQQQQPQQQVNVSSTTGYDPNFLGQQHQAGYDPNFSAAGYGTTSSTAGNDQYHSVHGEQQQHQQQQQVNVSSAAGNDQDDDNDDDDDDDLDDDVHDNGNLKWFKQ